jgi:hypothetical protein
MLAQKGYPCGAQRDVVAVELVSYGPQIADLMFSG